MEDPQIVSRDWARDCLGIDVSEMTYASDLIVYVGSRNESNVGAASTALYSLRIAFFAREIFKGLAPHLSRQCPVADLTADCWSE